MTHDLARSCFQLWPKIGDEGDKISRKKTGEALAETVFSRNFVTLGADFEGHNWKHDLARLCFMLYTPSYGNSQLKMEILEFTSKEAAAPLMSLAAPLWFWKFREENSEFGKFFSKVFKIWKISTFWIKISKVGSKFWRWEGYILSKLSINRFECWYFAQSLKLKLKLLNKIEVCSKYFEGWSKFETKLYSSPEPLVDNFLVRLSEKNLSQLGFFWVKIWV